MEEESSSKKSKTNTGSFPHQLWRFFTSMRLALVLILILGALCLIGALLIQAPSAALSNPEMHQAWLQNAAKPKLGLWADIFSFLRFFDIFHSPWFLAAGTLLILNILFCTLNRWKNISLALRGGNIKQASGFYGTGKDKAELKMSEAPSGVSSRIAAILKKHHFRVRKESSERAVNIAADRNRFSPLATYLTHFSLILFVLGFVIGGFWGFRETSFNIPEGSVREVGHNTGLSLKLMSFEDEYWDNGSPRDFRSQVVLYESGREVDRALVRVNEPLSYKGVSFYQSTFGIAEALQVRDRGEIVFDDSIPLTGIAQNKNLLRRVGSISLEDAGLELQLASRAFNGDDPAIGQDELMVVVSRSKTYEQVALDNLKKGVPKEFGGLEFTFTGEAQYSGFEVSTNPGINLIWTACAFLIIGLGAVFYFPYRQVWVVVEEERQGKSRLLMRSPGRSGISEKEMNELIRRIK